MKTKKIGWTIVPQVITLVCIIFLAFTNTRLRNENEELKKENIELKKVTGTIVTTKGVVSFNGTDSVGKFTPME